MTSEAPGKAAGEPEQEHSADHATPAADKPTKSEAKAAKSREKAKQKARRKSEKQAKRREKKSRAKKTKQAESKDTASASMVAHPGQVRSLLMASHPRQAIAIAVVVGTLVALMGRPLWEVGISAAAVLVVQLLLGITNDLTDRADDEASLAPRKPIASGWLPPGNASFAVAVLLLLSLPLALQNGPVAGIYLLATVPVGYVHNRWLHRKALSWVGWSATFALLAFFVTLGGWGSNAEGAMPTTQFVVLSAVLGFFVHFLTTLPDLVHDNRAKVKNLPLRVALRTGAPKLLVVTGVCTLVVVGLLVYYALTVGIAR